MAKKNKSKTKNKVKTIEQASFLNKNTWLAMGLGLIAFLLYVNTLGHGYVLDDYSAIKDNFVTQKGLGGMYEIWTEHYRYGFWNSKAAIYRPLTLSVFALIWEFFPDNTTVYHLVNVLYFAFTVSLLFVVLRRLLPRKTILLPLAITALFAVHPIHVEVVANIKSLDEILALFFSLKAIHLLLHYLERRNIFWLVSSVIVFGMALFSKESSVMFVLIFPLILYFFTKEKALSIVKISLLYLIPTAIFMYIRSQIVDGLGVGDNVSILDNPILGAEGMMGQMAMTFVFLGKYLWNLIIPFQLGSDFGYNQVPVVSFGNWQVLLSSVLYVGMGLFALWKFQAKDVAAFGILFFLITFAPLSNFLIKIGTAYGDRMVYIPSLGFLIALVYLIFKLGKIDLSDSQENLGTLVIQHKFPLLFVGLFVISYAYQTVNRNTHWESSYSLYQEDIKISPNSAKLRYHYALEIAKKGLDATDKTEKRKWFDLAKEQLDKAVSIYPQYHDAYAQLGLYYYRVNDKPKAMEMYQKSVALKPNSPKSYSNMGILYFENGDIENAQRVYEKAVKLDPRFVDARRNLGSVYAIKKEFNKAIEQFLAALAYAKDDPTINFYLGSSYRDSGNAAKGKPYLDKACQLDQQYCK